MSKIPKLLRFFYSTSFVGICLTILLGVSSLSYIISELNVNLNSKNCSLKHQLQANLKYEETAIDVAFRLLDRLDIDNVFYILESNLFDLYFLNDNGKIISTTSKNTGFNPMIEFTFENLLKSGLKDNEFHLLSVEQNKRDIIITRKNLSKNGGYLLGKMNLKTLLNNIDADINFAIFDNGGYVLKSNTDQILESENINSKFKNKINFFGLYVFNNNGYYIGSVVKFDKYMSILTYVSVYDVLLNAHFHLFLGLLVLLVLQIIYIRKCKNYVEKSYLKVVVNILNMLKNNKKAYFKPISSKNDDLYVLENSICEKLNKNNDFIEYIDELENRLRSFFSENQVPMLTVNSYTGQVINANDAAVEFYGYTKDDLLQKTLYSLNVKSAANIASNIYESVKNRQNYIKEQHIVKSKNGNLITRNVRIYPFSINSKVRYDYLMVIDFTDIDNNLTWIDNEKFYFKYGPVSALYIELEDDEFVVKDVYQKTGNVFGRNHKRDLIGKKYFDLFVGESQLGKSLSNLNDDKNSFIKRHNLIKQEELKSIVGKINAGAKNKLLEQSVYLKDRQNNNLYRVCYRFIAEKDLKIKKIIAFILDFNTSLYEDMKNELFHESFENPLSATMVLDGDRRILAINDAMCDLFNLDKNILLDNNKDISSIVEIDDTIKELIRTCMNANKSISDLIKIRIGSKYEVVLLTISSKYDKGSEKLLAYDMIDKSSSVNRNKDMHYIVNINLVNSSFSSIYFTNKYLCNGTSFSYEAEINFIILELLRLIDTMLNKHDIQNFIQEDLALFVEHIKRVTSLKGSPSSEYTSNLIRTTLDLCLEYIVGGNDSKEMLSRILTTKEELLKYV